MKIKKSEDISDMYTAEELAKHVPVQLSTIREYISYRIIIPNITQINSDGSETYYFHKDRVKTYCKRFGWVEITDSNISEYFIDFCNKMSMNMSYKPVFLISFFSCMNLEGNANVNEVVECFKSYYEDRIRNGLLPEKKNCLFYKEEFSFKEVLNLILKNPFKCFSDSGFISYSSKTGIMSLHKSIIKELNSDIITVIVKRCEEALNDYWKK